MVYLQRLFVVMLNAVSLKVVAPETRNTLAYHPRVSTDRRKTNFVTPFSADDKNVDTSRNVGVGVDRHGHDVGQQDGHQRRAVRLRRRGDVLRWLGGRQGPRARSLHRAQGPGGVLRVVALRFRGFRGLHLAQVGRKPYCNHTWGLCNQTYSCS
jgi:hypothetical protein